MTAVLYPRKLVQLNDVITAGLSPGDVPIYDGASFTFGPGGGGAAFSAGVSNLGNTLGDTGLTGTQLVLAGIGNLTLSQATDLNGGTISISGGTAAAGAFSLGVSGGNTAGQTGATGTRVLLAGGNGITLSQLTDANGGSITISGVTQSVQTQGLFDLTISGNTSGAPQLVSSGTLTLAGGNNITLSQNGNAITISGANAGGAQTGISSIAASDATYTSGQVEFTGSGIITVRSSAGQRVVIDASAAQTVQTQNLHNVTLSGNTAGAMAQVSSGTMTLAGGNNITLSQNGNAITISGAAAAGAQTAISGIVASNATYTSGTVTITGVGGGVTVSSNTGQRIDISVAAPVAQTNQAGSLFAVGNTTSSTSGTYDARTLSLRGDGIISIAATNSGFRISAAAQTGISSIVASDATYSSGSVQFTGSGMITVRSSANQRVVIDASQSVQTQNMIAVTLSGNTSGAQALISSGTMTIAGGNNITVSQNGNAITISGANVGGAQTGISGIANSQTTYTSGTVSLSELGAITIRSTTGNQYQFSVNSQTLQTSNVHNVTLSGNTAGVMAQISSGTMTLAGGNGITLSQNGNAVTISGGAGGGFSAGVSNLGNTVGDTGVTGTRLVLVGTDNITLSQVTDANGATVQISGQSAAAGAFSAGVSNIGNTAGATGISGSQLVLVGSGAMSLSQTTGANGNTVTISGPATSSLVGTSGISLSTAGSTISIYQTSGGVFVQELNPFSAAPQTVGQQGQGTLHIQPMQVHPDLRHDRILLGFEVSNATNSSGSFTLSAWAGLYTRNVSTLSLIASISASTNFTGSGTVGSYSLFGGKRWLSLPWTNTVSEGDYYMAILSRSTTGGAAGQTVNQIILTQLSNATFSGWSGLIGAATNATNQATLGLGVYTASTSAIPASIGITQINGTGTLAMMPPMYALRSGTV